LVLFRESWWECLLGSLLSASREMTVAEREKLGGN
jgi:hypothetical protein